MKLFAEAIIKFLMGLIIVGLLLFIPAGTLKYYNAWMLICVLFIPMFIVGIILIFKNPMLLKSRIDAKENEREQKYVIAISGLMFIVGFIIAGLNYRFSWIIMPRIIVIISIILFVISYILYGIILKENVYLFRTIKVVDEQKLVDTGFYKIVRHPMYLITIVLFLAIPLILNSFISFIIFLVYPLIIVKRINNEEKVLESELKGYKDYEKRVKYRLVPYVW